MLAEARATLEPRWQALALLFGGRLPRSRPAHRAEPALAALPDPVLHRLEEADPDRLESEYVRLFVNALPEVPCPPYASVRLEGALYGRITGQLRDLYRRWGAEPDDVPDHFAVEAAFLAGLLGAVREPVAPPAPDPVGDAAWLLDHLRSWAPGFLRCVERHDRTGVYASAARWGLALLEERGAGGV